jgi:hypothetical protein
MVTEQFAEGLNSSSSNAKAVVTLDWFPGPLTAKNSKKLTSINFPACEPDDPMPNWLCSKLTLHRFVKVAWAPLKESARIAYEVSGILIVIAIAIMLSAHYVLKLFVTFFV